jgi:hypothetical protein
MRLIFWLLGLVQVILAALFAREFALKRGSLFSRRAFSWALIVVLVLSGLGWLWFGIRDLTGAETAPQGASAPVPFVESQLTEQGALLGLAQGGELVILAPAGSAGGAARLTQISMVEGVGPESKEIDLQDYEGMMLVVRGHDGGGWIYEAEIVEQGGPLLTALAQRVYRPAP